MEKRRAIVMLGLPASGKGTQAEKISNRINATIVGIGDLVREAMKTGDKNSPLIAKIINNYQKGIPQSDDIAAELLENKIFQTSGNIIFDNYPFSKNQIDFFEALLKKFDFSRPEIIYIKINPNSSIERISKRLVCNHCKHIYLSGNIGEDCVNSNCQGKLSRRPDDTPEVMKKRIEFAQPRIDLVINHYKKTDKVHEINGEKSISEVEKSIRKIL